MDEELFIAAIVAAPRDDRPRLVYADWLDQRGDLRGAWLRVSVRLQDLMGNDAPPEMRAKLQWVREVAQLQRRLRELRSIVPEAWALRVQAGLIKHCNMRDANCPRDWLRLAESAEPSRRSCGQCQRSVQYCWSAPEVEAALTAGRPVVYSLAMDRA